MLVLLGLVATATVTLTTPLGDEIWTYILSFRNPAISRISSEWQTAFERPTGGRLPGNRHGVCASGSGGERRAPRALTPLLVSIGFIVFAAVSVRNLVFVAPAIALQIACSAPVHNAPRPRTAIVLATAGTLLAGLIWIGSVTPPVNAQPLGSRLLRYAAAHPPPRGQIASYAGVGSYLLWRSPRTPVVLDGWLEHFSDSELRNTYSLLNGGDVHLARSLRKLRIGAAIANQPAAIRALRRHGFVTAFATHDGAYLVRTGRWCPGPRVGDHEPAYVSSPLGCSVFHCR